MILKGRLNNHADSVTAVQGELGRVISLYRRAACLAEAKYQLSAREVYDRAVNELALLINRLSETMKEPK